MGLFGNKHKEIRENISASDLNDERRARRIASLETERSIKQQDIEELLFELGKKSGKFSIYNKKRLKKR
jgi:hypothetical protein